MDQNSLQVEMAITDHLYPLFELPTRQVNGIQVCVPCADAPNVELQTTHKCSGLFEKLVDKYSAES